MKVPRDYVLWCALLFLTGVGIVQYRHNTCRLHNIESMGGRSNLLGNKINPNTASWSSLARLPGIGPVRANDIVAYRDGHRRESVAFGSSDDLAKVKGIGPRTVEQIANYLTFAEH